MPKLKQSESQLKIRRFQAAVAKQLTSQGMKKEDLSLALSMSRSTLWTKLNDPFLFRLDELIQQHTIQQFTEDEKHILL